MTLNTALKSIISLALHACKLLLLWITNANQCGTVRQHIRSE